MITLKTHNLPGPEASAIAYDLALACRLAAGKGIAVPALKLHVVALERRLLIPVMVKHQVTAPGSEPPVSFAARCDWETLRQTFQLVPGEGNELWAIAGGAVGAQYAVGEALRCLLGIIWAGLDEENDTLFAPAGPLTLDVQSPKMALRARDGSPPPGSNVPAFLRWMGRNRYNLWRRQSGWFMTTSESYQKDCLQGCQERSILLTLGDHAMDYFLPDDVFEHHPEWFGLRDGHRVRKGPVQIPDCPHLDAELAIQPCYSNEELTDFITDRIASHVRDFPQCAIFGLWPHDGVNNWCQCGKCLQKTPYEHMYLMAMKLLPKLPAAMPVELIAYSNLLNPPKGALPKSDRTFTMLCPYLRIYRHRFYEPFDGVHETGRLYPAPDRINPLDEREYGPLFEDWHKICQQTGSVMAIFEYGAHFYDETRRSDRTRYLYLPDPGLITDEVEWYVNRGVRVFYICSGFRGWPDEFIEIMLAHTLWHGRQGLPAAQHAFYQAAFGDLAGPARATLTRVASELYGVQVSDELLAQLDDLARQAAPGAGEARTRRYQLWTQYIRLGKAVRQAELAYDRARMGELENQITEFLTQHIPALSGHFNTTGYLRYADINRSRAKEAVAGVPGRNYVL